MSVRVAIVYHSGAGHTHVLAEAVARGVIEAGATALLVPALEAEQRWGDLAAADAIVFGCPTYMGSASAPMKAFMDASSKVWVAQQWKDKIAAGFTNSSAHSGDKLSTLVQLAIFAAQHSMIWVGLDLLPGHNTSRGSADDLNRLGSHLGAMAQSNADQGASTAPPASDRRTAERLGRRVAEVAQRFRAGKPAPEPTAERHPTTVGWELPPADRADLPAPLRRTNLRALAARPLRFEHHLMVVARVGVAQLEIATASEPLFFAHANISDELAMALPTGDEAVDRFPYRTFLTDPETFEDVGRVNHGVRDLVLHAYGLLHWPGRLRPPYTPFEFPPGARRTGVTLVYCAGRVTPPGSDRPVFVSTGRDADVKAYTDRAVPFLLADTRREAARTLGAVGDTRLELLVAPGVIAPARGGYVVVLDAGSHHPADLVFIPPGAGLDGAGIERALLFSSDSADAQPPPESWDRAPAAPIPVFEDAPRGALPISVGDLHVEAAAPGTVRVRVGSGRTAEVPRYWLARFLYRLPLHGFAIGYLETYGGFFYDDRQGDYRLGVRGGGHATFTAIEIPRVVEELYRAVAPDGYVERLA